MHVERALAQHGAAHLAAQAAVVPDAAERTQPAVHRLAAALAARRRVLHVVRVAARLARPLEVRLAQRGAAARLGALEARAVPVRVERDERVGARRRQPASAARRPEVRAAARLTEERGAVVDAARRGEGEAARERAVARRADELRRR